MNDGAKTDSQVIGVGRPVEGRDFTRFWWLNLVRGVAALSLGIGLILPVEVIFKVDQVQGLLFQFVGIYLLINPKTAGQLMGISSEIDSNEPLSSLQKE